MFVTPRLGARLATRMSGRAILTIGILLTMSGDLLLWWLAQRGESYAMFLFGMLLTGAGAGLLNGETTKVMMVAIPPARAGMGSGLSATVRFAALLVGIAGLGAVLSRVTTSTFTASAQALGIDPAAAASAARRVASGDLGAALHGFPDGVRDALRDAGQTAFAHGFASASLLAATVAAAMAALTFSLVRAGDTAPAIANDPAREPVAMME
jgi:hypothetical protein